MSLTKSQAEALNAMVETGKVIYSSAPVVSEQPTTQREILLALVAALNDTEVDDALELLEEQGFGTVGSV